MIPRIAAGHASPHQEVTLATLKQIVRMLEERRRELLGQLGAIDRALAALGNAEAEATKARPTVPDVLADPSGPVLPTQLKARRVLSDSHKQALVAGKRKAREAQDVARGLAREMPDEVFVPGIGTRGEPQPPRLVKKAVKK
jgi:hypothetical protein